MYAEWELTSAWQCSNCKQQPGKHPGTKEAYLSPYCPNCGKPMIIRRYGEKDKGGITVWEYCKQEGMHERCGSKIRP